MERTFKKLKVFNLIMGFLHLAQGMLMLGLSNDFTIPIKTYFLKFDFTSKQLAPFPETVFELRLGLLVAGFLFLSAFAHFAISVLPSVNKRYNEGLSKGMNLYRWVEYAFSSSLMIVVIALLVGMYDGVSLMLMFGLNAMMILFGWVMEVHNQTTKKTDWTSYVFGCIAGAIPWIAVGLYLFLSGEGDLKPPTFVYYIFLSIFLFFNVFAINMIFQYKKWGKWRDYIFGEKAYIILSLVAKSLLAWQVWAGTLRPV